eukprot:635013-Lingulodinium_polyedra.AAC.1
MPSSVPLRSCAAKAQYNTPAQRVGENERSARRMPRAIAIPRCKSNRRRHCNGGSGAAPHHQYAPRWGKPERLTLAPGNAHPGSRRGWGANALGQTQSVPRAHSGQPSRRRCNPQWQL